MKNGSSGVEAAILPAALHNKKLEHLLSTNRLILFLDYDGTLTEIVNDPARAFLSEETRKVLRQLSSLCTVSILSGRDVEDVRRLVNVEGIVYAGSHGFDLITAQAKRLNNPDWLGFLPLLDQAENELRIVVREIPGAMIERKRFAISAHYRNVQPSQVHEVRERFLKVASSFPRLRKSRGKMVFELLPNVKWNKGKALTYLSKLLIAPREKVLPVCLGDDLTDEDAFSAIRNRGVGILVEDGEDRPSLARYTLRNPTEVRIFLEEVAELLERSHGEWSLQYRNYDPPREKLRETLCTVGNGYFATRGAAPESKADGIHYPGTYVAGCYNRLESEVKGQKLEHESLVNVPNWLLFTLRIEDGDWFDLDHVEILSHDQELDMRNGVLTRNTRFKDQNERLTQVVQRRFVHMEYPHLAGLETTITAENWHGKLDVLSAIDGAVENRGVERYRDLNSEHLDPDEQYVLENDLVYLSVRTSQSKTRISECAKTTLTHNGKTLAPGGVVVKPKYIGQQFSADLKDGERVIVEKLVALYTSRDPGISECGLASREAVMRAPSFSKLIERHSLSWGRLWQRFGVSVPGDIHVSRDVIFNSFHILQSTSPNTISLDAGASPRGLTGEGYRGHVLWDELFIFPFLNFRIPDLTRSLLMYRYRRLSEAEYLALSDGFQGAMYPWQSGSDGREESQLVHLNPDSGRWIPDNSHLQRHVNIAIAYNIWTYYQITGDLDFLTFYGVEIMTKISRYFASLANYNKVRGRYEIHGVMGPDEYHDAYPGAIKPGLSNNAYTNVMVVWVFLKTLEALKMIPEERQSALLETVGVKTEEIEHWQDITRKMILPFQKDGVIIDQFEGYEKLKELDWDGYRKKYGDIERLDRILETEHDSPNNYKVTKQADVLMLFYLLSDDELREIFTRLRYDLTPSSVSRNIGYYIKRTSNGSTLSRIVGSSMLARTDREGSWRLLKEALESDLSDIQGGTSVEGIHLGAMAGSLDILQRCYLGLVARNNSLSVDPRPPEELKGLELSVRYREHLLNFSLNSESLRISSTRGSKVPINVRIAGKFLEMKPGEERRIPLITQSPSTGKKRKGRGRRAMPIAGIAR